MARTAVHERTRPVTLGGLSAVVDGFCDSFDAALLTGAQAAAVAEAVGMTIRRLQGVQAQTAARVDECGVAKAKGFSSTAGWLADTNGTSFGEAAGVVDVGRAMTRFPATAERVKSGEVSLPAARQITDAARADPAAEASLLDVAKRRDFGALRDRANHIRQGARSAEDAAARHARLRRTRRFSDRPDSDGGVRLDGQVAPQDWARAKAVVDRFQQALFDQARRAGQHESSEAYRADALIAAICESALRTDTSKPEVAVRRDLVGPVEIADKSSCQVSILVDAIALKRGWAAPGESCEIPGVGPVSVEWVNRLLPSAVATVLVHDAVDIRAYCSMTRHIPTPIRLGLAARDRNCVVPGCGRAIRLQIDHRQEHGRDGPTTWDNLGRLCEFHHAQKSYQGARLERDLTEWLWWPPPDPCDRDDPGRPTVPWRAPVGEHLGHWRPDRHPPDT